MWFVFALEQHIPIASPQLTANRDVDCSVDQCEGNSRLLHSIGAQNLHPGWALQRAISVLTLFMMRLLMVKCCFKMYQTALSL